MRAGSSLVQARGSHGAWADFTSKPQARHQALSGRYLASSIRSRVGPYEPSCTQVRLPPAVQCLQFSLATSILHKSLPVTRRTSIKHEYWCCVCFHFSRIGQALYLLAGQNPAPAFFLRSKMGTASRGGCGSEGQQNAQPIAGVPAASADCEGRAADGDVPEWKRQVQAEPLVGPAETLQSLVQEFEGNEALRAKARKFMEEQEKMRTDGDRGLSRGEAGGKDSSPRWVMRRVRKDGCCFYRGYMYGLFLFFLRRPEEIRVFTKKIKEDLLPKVLQAK